MKAPMTLAAGITIILIVISGIFIISQSSGTTNPNSHRQSESPSIQYRYYIFSGEPFGQAPCAASIGGGNGDFIMQLLTDSPGSTSTTYGVGSVYPPPPASNATSTSSESTGTAPFSGTTDGYCLRSGYSGPTITFSSSELLLYLCCEQGAVTVNASLYDFGQNNFSQQWHFSSPKLIADAKPESVKVSEPNFDCHSAATSAVTLEPTKNATLRNGDILGIDIELGAVEPGSITLCEGFWSNYQSTASSLTVAGVPSQTSTSTVAGLGYQVSVTCRSSISACPYGGIIEWPGGSYFGGFQDNQSYPVGFSGCNQNLSWALFLQPYQQYPSLLGPSYSDNLTVKVTAQNGTVVESTNSTSILPGDRLAGSYVSCSKSGTAGVDLGSRRTYVVDLEYILPRPAACQQLTGGPCEYFWTISWNGTGGCGCTGTEAWYNTSAWVTLPTANSQLSWNFGMTSPPSQGAVILEIRTLSGIIVYEQNTTSTNWGYVSGSWSPAG